MGHPLSVAAIICVCSFLPGVFVVCVKWSLWFSNGLFERVSHLPLHFAPNSWQLHQKCVKCWHCPGENTFEWFSLLKGVETCKHSLCPSTGSICEKWRKFTKSSTKTNKVPFRRFSGRLGILYGMWNMYANYIRGLQCMVDLHEVCSLIAHQQPEAGCAFVCQELLDKSEVTRTPSWRSQQEIKPRFAVTTQKLRFQLKNPFSIQLNKARQLRLNVKSMLMMVFDLEVAYQDFVPPGQTVFSITGRRFCIIWGSKSTENVHNGNRTRTGWFAVTVHRHTLLCQCSSFLSAINLTVVPLPSYLPDLANVDFIFLRMKLLTICYAIPKYHFQHYFQQWKQSAV
jgi:hypothetical protein